jgi:hypothetical protein
MGVAEGTRTADGGRTKAWYGHTDPGNGKWNVGTFSAQGLGSNPNYGTRYWLGQLNRTIPGTVNAIKANGIQEGTALFYRLLYNALDLSFQAPLAYPDFLKKIPEVLQKGGTVESIARARADSFYDPRSGRLDAPGFGNNYSRLLRDQLRRAGSWEYKGRI